MNHEEGCGLDEMKAHVFLEQFDEAFTVREMRSKLRSTGAIGESERPKAVPLYSTTSCPRTTPLARTCR